MTVEEFHKARTPFFIDSDNLIVQFPTSKHRDSSHAEWFTQLNYPWCHAIRGYHWKDDNDEFLMIYWNNFEVPNITMLVVPYLFEYFPDVKWIGFGCHVGEPGEIWKPQFVVKRS